MEHRPKIADSQNNFFDQLKKTLTHYKASADSPHGARPE